MTVGWEVIEKNQAGLEGLELVGRVVGFRLGVLVLWFEGLVLIRLWVELGELVV